ncbi:hypothetical protein MRB53_013471 [Persea americana]|uniref:Uncharacterized protein n=1 Tax=Persea americana TaxID=3435 RepID=A0ACC2K869_PERAE|nr:hypothetical protein MRB53_013471 [Persea americana]
MEEDFLQAWDDMLEKYDLRTNGWLSKLFDERKKWALVYGRNTFCADMKSTQRSEGLNRELKNYLDPRKVIVDFFDHFERLLEDRRFAELQANFKMTQTLPTIKVQVPILMHAATVYTPSVYKMFEKEYLNGLSWQVEEQGDVGTTKNYCVFNEKPHRHFVVYDPEDESITCSCRKFEFVGIMCGHSLIATIHRLKQIPERYVLKRWTREAASCSLKTSDSGMSHENEKKDMSRRYNVLLRNFVKIAAKASESEKKFQEAFKLSKSMLHNIENIPFEEKKDDNSKVAASEGDVLVGEFEEDDSVAVVNAIKKKVDNCRGRRRVKSCLEKGSKKRVQKSQCKKAKKSNTTQYNAFTQPSYSILQVMKEINA